jgi:dihydrofolate reductase
MPKLVLYIAASLDGYIARPDGGIDWLVKHDNPVTDYGYNEFYATIDAMLMGRKTYEVTLGFGEWPHGDRPCYVATNSRESPAHAIPVRGDAAAIIEQLKGSYRKIWLVGGGKLIAQALACKGLDEIILTTIPVILGTGIRLFGDSTVEADVRHVETRCYTGGLVQTRYLVG